MRPEDSPTCLLRQFCSTFLVLVEVSTRPRSLRAGLFRLVANAEWPRGFVAMPL